MKPVSLLPIIALFFSAQGFSADSLVERGRYLVQIAGCNDCHTEGYMAQAGQIPESQWLMGSTLGWNGPWGTTYAPNLRLYMQDKNQDQWLSAARNMRSRPPMPWFGLAEMNEEDLKGLYQYISQLSPLGQPAPRALPPGEQPPPPFAVFPAPPPKP